MGEKAPSLFKATAIKGFDLTTGRFSGTFREATELDVRAAQIGESIYGDGYNNGLFSSNLSWKQKIHKLKKDLVRNHMEESSTPNNLITSKTDFNRVIRELEELISEGEPKT